MKHGSLQNAIQQMSVRNKTTDIHTPIAGKKMIKNASGVYVFEVSIWKYLERFLISGTEGGDYTTDEKQLTEKAAANTIKAINTDGRRAVDMIVNISVSGRALKNDQAVFALAIAAASPNMDTRRYALSKLSAVCRTGTHLFDFLNFVTPLRGWGGTLRKAVSDWYLEKDANKLALQLTKYQARNGWSHQDVLRMAHPMPQDKTAQLALRWASGRFHKQLRTSSKHYSPEGYERDLARMEKTLPMIAAFEEAKKTDSEKYLINLIVNHGLQMEHIPTEKRTNAVLEALLPNLGITALIRQLPTYTKKGIIGKGNSAATQLITNKFRDMDLLRKGRIHPIQLLIALKVYSQGHGEDGSSVWTPNPLIQAALDEAFYLSFGTIEPTGLRTLVALDVSGSMSGRFGGKVLGASMLTPAMITAAMSMVVARTEPDSYIMGFSHEFKNLGVDKNDSLQDAMKKVVQQNFGATDVGLPMAWARDNRIPVDVFYVYTDNEVNKGRRHPIQELQLYQQMMGIGAKLISVATNVNNRSIVEDTSMTMNVCGFDANAPHIMNDFAKN